MKVLVLSTKVPFVHGGAEELYDHLLLNLKREGLEAEGMRLPFTWDPAERLIDEMFIAKRIRLTNVDRVIALKFPAYLVPWHNKILWVVHQYRQAYDLLDAGQSNIPDSARGREIVSAIKNADKYAFSEAKQVLSISPVVAERLRYYCGVNSSSMRVPLNDPELFCGGESQGYILATGRVSAGKRQQLLVRALRFAPKVRLVIAGPPDSPLEEAALRRLAVEEGVEDRLHLDLRFVPRHELAKLVNGAVAVAYVPFQEDSYGYCTMEAFQAGKPVITVTDSGGVLDIVVNGQTGLVAQLDAEALGRSMSRLSSDVSTARKLGLAGQAAMKAKQLDWPTTIQRLLA